MDRAHLTRENIQGLADPRVREQVVLHADQDFQAVAEKARNAEAGFQYLASLQKPSAMAPAPATPAPPKVTHEPMDISTLTDLLGAMQGITRDKLRWLLCTDNCWYCGDARHYKSNCP